MPKTIGFTYDLRSDYPLQDGDPEDLNAEFDKPDTIESIKSAIESGGHNVLPIGNVRNLINNITDFKNKVDIIFNICEGVGSRNREAQVPVILEAFSIPYIGSDGLTMSLALDKVMTKKILIAEDIPTPQFVGINRLDELTNFNHLHFPVIVKLRNEGTSKGLTDESVVHDKNQLKKSCNNLFNIYNNHPLIVEELISGTEFTVAIIGNEFPEILPPVQIIIDGKVELGEMIYTFDKVVANDQRYICPAKINKELESKLKDLTLKTYNAVGCLDFGRVDFRVDKNNNPYVLELNPLPSLSLEDVFNLAPYAAGFDYNKAVNKIINAALKRLNLI